MPDSFILTHEATTDTLKQSPWETENQLAMKFPAFLEPKIHYLAHKNLPLDCNLCQFTSKNTRIYLFHCLVIWNLWNPEYDHTVKNLIQHRQQNYFNTDYIPIHKWHWHNYVTSKVGYSVQPGLTLLLFTSHRPYIMYRQVVIASSWTRNFQVVKS